jgi:uncharacterized protein YjbI with pentapeptide repeats
LSLDPFERLKKAIAERRTARDLNLRGADLRGTDLSGLRADGLGLDDCDLRDAKLAGANWRGCTLRDARLDGADLGGATLRLCDLDQVRADGASLVRARIENCTARGARLDGADLTGASLTDTDLSRASLRGAGLEGVSASGADLRGADLRGARLRGADLADADLRGADLREADFDAGDLAGADLRGTLGVESTRFGGGDRPPWEPEPQGEDDGADLGWTHAGPASDPASAQAPDLPKELLALAESVAPLVRGLLEGAGDRGLVDPQAAAKLAAEAQRLGQSLDRSGGRGPGRGQRREVPGLRDPETLAAVARTLSRTGAQTIPTLVAALAGIRGQEPPPEVQALILSLRRELGLPEDADAEAVLACLASGLGQKTPGADG